VLDAHTQKIALGDIDVPATIKANDDRGVEFQVPKAKQSKSTRPERQQRDNEVPENLLSNSTSSLPPS
jgi:hypothetical protein